MGDTTDEDSDEELMVVVAMYVPYTILKHKYEFKREHIYRTDFISLSPLQLKKHYS
jgi:hypothetical protein